VNNEFETAWKEVILAKFDVSQCLPEGTEENKQKASVTIAGLQI
jgi:hypothetical protein